MNFWDTSALVALGVEEPHRERALRVLEGDDRMAVWWGTTVEYVAAVSRREREGILTTAEASELLARLHALSRAWYEVQPERRVKELAQRLLRGTPASRRRRPPARVRARRRRGGSVEHRLRVPRRAPEPGGFSRRIRDPPAVTDQLPRVPERAQGPHRHREG